VSDWQVHLEFEEGTSSKFWRARVEGKTLYVNYGKIGSNGQTQVKEFANADGAQKEFDKLVREKRKKGYADAGGGGGGDEDEDDDDDEGGGDDDEGGGDDDDDEPAPRKKSGLAALAAAAASDDDDDGDLYTLTANKKKIELRVSIDGKSVRMKSVETYESTESAKKALDRLKKNLIAEGYKEG
jgi:predicted DNA-binding WGR domain protein